jgi:hypothetical protein
MANKPMPLSIKRDRLQPVSSYINRMSTVRKHPTIISNRYSYHNVFPEWKFLIKIALFRHS